MANVFSVQIFFIVFRECVEAAIIISVLLAFVKQGVGKSSSDRRLYKKLIWQIWIGALAGLFICLAIGGAFIGVFYTLGRDIWASSEDLWEGIFSIIAVIMITIMGVGMLRVNKMKEKWRLKIARALLASNKDIYAHKKNRVKRLAQKYALALLPFITTLREGTEAVVFVGGVSLGTPATAFPLPVICGLIAGFAVGYVLYKGGSATTLQVFLIISTCFLYLIAAGLFSRAIWYFQTYVFSNQAGGDVAEQGSGPGSYNIFQSVWHVNCCNPETDNGWEIFNAILGWQNSATYGSVISYNIYWLFIILVFIGMWYKEKKGYLPGFKRFTKQKETPEEAAEIVARAQREAGRIYGAHDSNESKASDAADTEVSNSYSKEAPEVVEQRV